MRKVYKKWKWWIGMTMCNMSWTLFLEPFTKRAQSVRIRTYTTLDQDCVLKATVHVCTACMIVSLLTTCMNCNTPPLAQVAPFGCKIRESNAEVTLDTKLSKHVCQLILVCTTQRFQARSAASWPFHSVEAITTTRVQVQHGPNKASALSAILARQWASKSSSPISLLGVSQFNKISHCLLLLLCSCFAHCCHDPFIVWSASNLSTVPCFHSVCASVSMFAINTDNCLFPFPFPFLFLSSRGSLYTYQGLFMCTDRDNSVYVHTKSADSAIIL